MCDPFSELPYSTRNMVGSGNAKFSSMADEICSTSLPMDIWFTVKDNAVLNYICIQSYICSTLSELMKINHCT